MAQRIDSFGDIVLAVDQLRAKNPNQILNDAAAYRNYTFFQAFNRKKRIESGNGIETFIQLTKDNGGGYANPDDTVSYQRTYGTQSAKIHWALHIDSLTWGRLEEEMVGEGSDKLKTWFKPVMQRTTRMRTACADFMEASLWAAPHADMEITIGSTTTPTNPRRNYSIPSLITPLGAAPSAFSGGTVQGINPSTYANWKNQSETFTDFDAEIEEKLWDLQVGCDWQSAGPSIKEITGTPQDGGVFYTDFATYRELGSILKNRNDRMTYLGQYHNGINFNGTAIRQVQAIGGKDTAETARRIFYVDWNYLDPVVFRDYFMKFVPPQGKSFWEDANTPLNRYLPQYTMFNLALSGRKRHGIITHETYSL